MLTSLNFIKFQNTLLFHFFLLFTTTTLSQIIDLHYLIMRRNPLILVLTPVQNVIKLQLTLFSNTILLHFLKKHDLRSYSILVLSLCILGSFWILLSCPCSPISILACY
mmetsp:Transcript_19433/g.16659  ORF Transcript_19433/g.16659 Transcript_19433/m.16659 type:complete len:109 (-) Transcript_19433:1196-1522(-)